MTGIWSSIVPCSGWIQVMYASFRSRRAMACHSHPIIIIIIIIIIITTTNNSIVTSRLLGSMSRNGHGLPACTMRIPFVSRMMCIFFSVFGLCPSPHH